jgi:hypothetical protein
VRLETGVEAFGLTLEKGTGEPISLAEVVFTPPAFSAGPQGRPDAPEEESLVATSLETGEFRLLGLAPGRYRIEARAPGYVSAVLPSAPVPFGGRITFTLVPSGQLEGVVLGTEGQPAAGAEVFAVSPGHEAAVLTDTEGHFSVELPPGTYAVSARRGEEAGVLRGVTATVGQRVQGLRLGLGAGARVSGKVVRKDGSPVLGARVEAWLRETWVETRPQWGHALAGTDESGAFSLPPLAAGTYVIGVFLPGGGRLRQGPLTLAAGEHASLTFLCELRDGLECQPQDSIQGRIIHSRGAPVRHTVLDVLSPDSVQTSTAYEFIGDRFELRGLPPGPSQLAVTADGMRAALRVDLRPGERKLLEIPVYPGVSMTGRLIDAATRQPVEAAWVLHPLFGTVRPGKDGRFTFSDLPPGEQLLFVTRLVPGTQARTKTVHPVRLSPDRENDVGDLELPAP